VNDLDNGRVKLDSPTKPSACDTAKGDRASSPIANAAIRVIRTILSSLSSVEPLM